MNLATMSPQEKQALIDAFYWYHSIPFGDGLKSHGTVDPAEAFDRYGFPSLRGKSALDVGTGDGYFAFAFERLGAQRILAVDVDRWCEEPEFDLPSRTRLRRLRKFRPAAGQEGQVRAREKIIRTLGFDRPNPFYLAHSLLQSHVELRYLNIYDLPILKEQFDLVFVGTVTDALQDLAAAFEAVRVVTRHHAILACANLADFEVVDGWRRFLFQTIRGLRVLGRLGDQVMLAREEPVALYTANAGGAIWRPSITCVRELLLSAGFQDVEVHARVALKNLRHGTLMNHVVFHAFV